MMKEVHCKECGKLLMRYGEGIEIYCNAKLQNVNSPEPHQVLYADWLLTCTGCGTTTEV